MTSILMDPKGPPHQFKPNASDLVYLLKVPTIAERLAFRLAIAQSGAKPWQRHEMMGFVEQAAPVVLGEDPDQLARQLDLLAQWRTANYAFQLAMQAPGPPDQEKLTALAVPVDQLSVQLRALEQAVQEMSPEYAARTVDAQLYPMRYGIEAARHFLVGWQGVDDEWPGMMSDELLDQLPEVHLTMIGNEVRDLMELGGARQKKSPSASGDSANRTTSNGQMESPEESSSQKQPRPTSRSGSEKKSAA